MTVSEPRVTDADEEAAVVANIAPAHAGAVVQPNTKLEGEEGEVEQDSSTASRGRMTPRRFVSRVYRLGSRASSIDGEWQTFTSVMTTVSASEGAHDYRVSTRRLACIA